ncbi:MAG TPA: class 1 fructose-bisphosphatase [Devosiaceae bacterium]|nr:class 1 fructose-bisphosphatase [Devosiaceae bacterium]
MTATAEKTSLAGYLAAADPAIAGIVGAIARVAAQLSLVVSRGPLEPGFVVTAGDSADADTQNPLDILADRAFAAELAGSEVRWFASEERAGAEPLNPQGHLALALDPLDGATNIGTNVSIGTIFSLYPAAGDIEASFMRPGREQIAAGYVIYGPQTAMLVTLGAGVAYFVYDREAGEFICADPSLTITDDAPEFAINASNYRHWSQPIRSYIDDCLSGEEGPRGHDFNMRWVASLVAETHRIMMRGGIFLYPGDARPGYARGRLRMVHECAPIAMLVEQAGGAATDGCDRLLDQTPAELQARTPFVFGSADKVARVSAYHDLPASEVAPLFGKRGLFTA